jgi:hypothetical protein
MNNVEREIREAEILGDLKDIANHLLVKYPNETQEQLLDRAEKMLEEEDE